MPWANCEILVKMSGVARAQIVLLAAESVEVFGRLVAAATRRFVMQKGGERGPNDSEAGAARSETEVDIVIGDGETFFIQRTDARDRLLRNKEAGAGHRGERLARPEPPHRSWKILLGLKVPMAGEIAEAHDDPGMLNRAVRIKKLRADDADIGIIEAAHHLLEPIRL